MNRYDIRMPDTRQSAGLCKKMPDAGLLVPRVDAPEFERHLAVEPRVHRAIDLAETSFPDLFVDRERPPVERDPRCGGGGASLPLPGRGLARAAHPDHRLDEPQAIDRGVRVLFGRPVD